MEEERSKLMKRTIGESFGPRDLRVELRIGPGFQITDVVRRWDYRHLSVVANDPEITVDDLRAWFKDAGHDEHLEVIIESKYQKKDAKKKEFKVRFTLSAALSGHLPDVSRLTAAKSIQHKDFCLKLWHVSSCMTDYGARQSGKL